MPYNPVIGWKPITKVILIPEKFKYLNLRPHSSSCKERSKKQNVTVFLHTSYSNEVENENASADERN